MIRFLHPDFALTRAITGRLATRGWPVLGMPKHSEEGRKLRGCVRAPEGWVICEEDYSQIELRALAQLSGDREMVAAFRKGEDIHAKTAHRVFGAPKDPAKQDDSKHRLPAKTGNFGVAMGLMEKGLTEQVHKYGNLEWSADCPGCKTFRAPHLPTCDSLLFFKEFFKTYPGVKAFQEDRRGHALQTGKAYGMWGMEWELAGVWSPHEEIREQVLRQAHAIPVSEGAQRLIKLAMAAIFPLIDVRKVRPICQIHDSLVWLVREEYLKAWHTIVKRTMESVTSWTVPIVAEGTWGYTWHPKEQKGNKL